MNKKLICIALSALILTACENESARRDGEEYGENLTESFTEEQQMPLPESGETTRGKIELALFDPFYEKAQLYKDNENLKDEMKAAAEKISDARGFLYANSTAFYQKSKYCSSYADTENPLETNDTEEYSYCPLNTDIAKTENELARYLRGCFTENYISDEELMSTLFEPENENTAAEYKTIDGTLCMRQQYTGVMTALHFDELICINSYDGNSAQVIFYGLGLSYPPTYFFVDIVKSEEYGWRLDSIEYKDYNETETQLLYNAVTLRQETLNSILGGGNTPENPRTYYENGELYTETDIEMTINEMREFFADTFRERTLNFDLEITEGSDLRSAYTEKYIDGVYIEQNGVLYRKDSAPRWYLPEFELDPFSVIKMSVSGAAEEWAFLCEQDFYDAEKDVSFSEDVAIAYKAESSLKNANEYEYYSLYIASELPVMESGSYEIEAVDSFEDTDDIDPETASAVAEAAAEAVNNMGLMEQMKCEPQDVHILSYDGSSAEVGVRSYWNYPSNNLFMTMITENGEWILPENSETDMRYCAEFEVSVLADILTKNEEIWRDILGGGTAVPNGRRIISDGVDYAETDIEMSIDDMKKFFADNLSPTLCAEYTEKYIDGVYAEQDGVLYRRENAPKWYLPSYEPNPYDGMITSGRDDNGFTYTVINQDFYDYVLGETFSAELRGAYLKPDINWRIQIREEGRCRYFIYGRYLDSELPIRERQEVPDK